MAAGAGTAPAPAPALVAWNSGTHLHVDGNSIYAAHLAQAMDTLIWEIAPFSTSGATRSNSAIAGQTWQDMKNNPGEVDAAWVAGKTNVLLLSETTNSVFNEGKSVSEIIQTATQYIAARQAAHPWRILLSGTIPRGGTASDATNNAKLSEVDAYMAANYKDMGAHGYVGFRDIPMYNHDGTTAAPFTNYQTAWNETAAPWIHPKDGSTASNTGKRAMAAKIATALQQLPA